MVKQILPKAGEAILALFNKLGGNMNNVLGSRSNITFLGKGKTPEGFIDSDINIDAIGVLGKNKILEELESSMGYLTAGKLNDVQANKLLSNMQKIDEVFNPTQVSNITDMATGIRNLDQEGIASLRAEQNLADDVVKDVSDMEWIRPGTACTRVSLSRHRGPRRGPDSDTISERYNRPRRASHTPRDPELKHKLNFDFHTGRGSPKDRRLFNKKKSGSQ